MPARAQTVFADGFDSAQVAWRDAGGDTRFQIEVQRRVQQGAYRGSGCEYIQLSAGSNGTYVHLALDVTAARVIDELKPSLWLRSNHNGLQLQARVVLPRTLDRNTGRPVFTFVAGSSYEGSGRWQRLSIERLPDLLAQATRTLRAELGPHVDPREAYLDRLVLNVYGGAGRTQVWIDELEMTGFIKADAAGGAAADSLSAPRPDIRFNGSALLVDSRPLFPRIVEHQGESLALLKSLGFNGIKLAETPSDSLLEEASQAGMWIVCPPPRPPGLGTAAAEDLSPFDDRYNRVLAWHLGENLTGEHLELVRQWAAQVRHADGPVPRPLLCSADDELRAFSRLVQLLLIERFPLGTGLEMADYGTWLRERPQLAVAGTPVWTTVQTQLAPELAEQVSILSAGEASGPAAESEQIRLLVQSALAAGCRGLFFASHSPLDAADDATRERALTLALVNLELDLIQDLVSQASPAATVRGSDPAIRGAVLQADRMRLLLPIWTGRGAQFVPGQSAGNGVALVVPGVPESNQAFEVTPAGMRPLVSSRQTGGVRITLDEFGPSAMVLLSGDSLVQSTLSRRLAVTAPRGARWARDLAAWKWKRVAAVDARLTALSRGVAESSSWLDSARSSIATADAHLAAGDHLSAWLHAERAMRPLRLLERAHWERAAGSLGSPVASPLATCFDTLPLHWSLVSRLRDDRDSTFKNLLAEGQMEELDRMLAAGWRHFQRPQQQVVTEAELSPQEPHSGGFSLRLAVRPSHPQSPPALVESVPIWVTTPPVPVRAGQLVRIRGWVRIGTPIIGSVDGLMIIDSLGGEPLAERFGETGGWKPFVLYRAAPADGAMNVTFALTGLGEAWIDDLAIEVEERKADVGQGKDEG